MQAQSARWATLQDLVKFAGLRAADVSRGLDALDGQLLRFATNRAASPSTFSARRGPVRAASRPCGSCPSGMRSCFRTPTGRASCLLSTTRGDQGRLCVLSTFLVGGVVAGLWKTERRRVKLEPFVPLPRSIRREAEDEARRLHAFLA
jgi:hypothetical protein